VIDRAALLARYDREMRADPPRSAGSIVERTAQLVRERGSQDTILFAHLSSATAPEIVREEARSARESGRTVEWKVYAHDVPPELPDLLARAGFQPDEAETLVVLDLSAPPNDPVAPGVAEIREVTDAAIFADALTVSEAAFGPSGPETLREFRDRLADPTVRLFVAYIEGRPVASGRLELPPGRAFAGLWGGGTVPEARHRGVYRSLVRARAEHARQRGYHYLTVDARETSRPILERIGFVALSGIRGWVLGPTP
jgi:ribosomal protein S18 acetylase RimI-like enzyme